MNAIQPMSLFYFTIGILLLKTAISTAMFSQSWPDGGAWPFVLLIFGILDLIYANFLIWLIRRRSVVVLHAALSTLALSILMFLLLNFAWLFGREGVIASTNLHLGVLESDITPYVLYLFFAFVPLLSGRARDRVN